MLTNVDLSILVMQRYKWSARPDTKLNRILTMLQGLRCMYDTARSYAIHEGLFDPRHQVVLFSSQTADVF